MKYITAGKLAILFTIFTPGVSTQEIADQMSHTCAVNYNASGLYEDKQVSGAGLVAEWNNLLLEWVRLSERGPTISGRFAAYVNIAMYDAWAVFDEQASGVLTDVEGFPALQIDDGALAKLRNAAMSCAAYRVINEIGESILKQKYLESSVGENAAERLTALQEKSASLHSSISITPLDENIADVWRIGDAVADAVIAYSRDDGSNQQGDYSDTTGYSVKPWVMPEPALDDGISDYNFLGSGYSFSGFDPTLAEGYNAGVATVHPMVSDGTLRLTTNWQSLTQMGVFPPADDGGEQIPLTPHWGQVNTLVMAAGDQLRPASVVGPYDAQGQLSEQWVRESNQLLEFSVAMQDDAEGVALQRAKSEYWELGDATEYPPGWWLQRATDFIDEYDLTQRQAIKLSLSVSIATFEAGIASWDTKFHFDTVRPVTAINELFYGTVVSDWRGDRTANTDDRDHWRPYQLRRNLTPPFPDVPSGHSTFSSSASVVISQLLGTNQIGYVSTPFVSRFDLSDGFDGDPDTGNEEIALQWDYLSQAVEEAGLSRLYGGIHMMEGNLIGLTMGTRLGHMTARYVDALFGEPERDLPALVFGTGLADTLRTPGGVCGSVEVYGFHEVDVLNANLNCEGVVNLFGGDGLDSYLIEGSGEVWIRDYEHGETITIGFSRLKRNSSTDSSGSWIDEHQVSTDIVSSTTGIQTTTLFIGGVQVAQIEGVWPLSKLTIKIGE